MADVNRDIILLDEPTHHMSEAEADEFLGEIRHRLAPNQVIYTLSYAWVCIFVG